MSEQATTLFAMVYRVFNENGLLGRSHRLLVGDRAVRVLCDETSFTVYAVNEQHHVPPGVPGWMVCRLTNDDFCSMDEDLSGHVGECIPGSLDSAQGWVEAVIGSINKGLEG